jgi:hypothetical protein
MRVIVIAVLVGVISPATAAETEAPPAAGKPESFEAALQGAQPVADLKALLDPLFADCKRDDDVEARQCTLMRDWLVERLRGETYVGVGDESALTFSPYDAMTRQIEIEVHGCLACGRPLVFEEGGAPHFVTTRVPKAIKGRSVVGLDVGFHELRILDGKEAVRWQKEVAPRLRVQYVFRLGQQWKSGAFDGVAFVPVAYRVFDRCTGKVLASDPPSTTGVERVRDASCPETAEDAAKRLEAQGLLPEQLSRDQIKKAMSSLATKVHDCYAEFEVNGTVTVRLVVEGDGALDTVEVLQPFDKAPIGYCVRSAAKTLKLPHFSGEKMTIEYPFQLR